MILFKFPQKKIVLDCFTNRLEVLETAPIVPAMKLIPDWWRELPTSFSEEERFTTMRNCAGMVDYYKNSIVVPLWCDLSISFNANGGYNWQFSDLCSSADTHDVKKQATGFLENYVHLKLISPWAFRTKKDIKWVWSHPVYNYKNNNNVVSLPGIVNFKHQSSAHINILINNQTVKNIVIPQGQPMVHMTPMSDKKVDIVRHLVSTEEFNRINARTIPITFFKNYQTILKRREQFKDCPFHNHTEGK